MDTITPAEIPPTPQPVIFIRIPKTASTSILETFNPYPHIHFNQRDHFLKSGMTPGLAEVHRKALPADLWTRATKAAFVRNPYDRCVSSWQHCILHKRLGLGDLSFEDFVQRLVTQRNGFNRKPSLCRALEPAAWFDLAADKAPALKHPLVNSYGPDAWHSCWQFSHLVDWKGRLIVNFIGRFESLKEDYLRLCELAGLPPLELPHLHKAERTHYSAYYNDHTRRKVAEYYRQDLERFEYTFED